MTSFAELGLPVPVVQELQRQGITEPFPIQASAIPDALKGHDLLGRGPTGSGKTFTFGLPMITRLAGKPSKPARPRGLILVPTRELAAQVSERLSAPANAMGLRVMAIVGGVPIKRHLTALARPVDILVATPGRAQDLINQGKLSFKEVEITTLDEADQMADMGFLPQVTKLLNHTPREGQRLLFSATLDGEVDKLVKKFLRNPITHSTAPTTATVNTMTHYRLQVPTRDARNEVITAIAARQGRTIMFMRTKHAVDRQVRRLRQAGINAAGIHGDKGQGSRTAALAAFSDGSVPVLVATDIAARGIDIGDVSLVVHIDPPAEHKAYVHRAGRTARAGQSGKVVTMVMPEQEKDLEKLLIKAGVKAAKISVHPGSKELAQITGARIPDGPPLAPFGATTSATSPKRIAAPKNGGRGNPARAEAGSKRGRRGAPRTRTGNGGQSPRGQRSRRG
ncbi:DEAD/DEAH box helicase [Corynebacterium caspium]|uniref:DEAD/DEAH box helicase n=1 Tax=Corynebacterium caspium TaxID=234828 RepID=UPI000382C8AB|nr:DEAD/DEAH box helicase [Corynebacterium caspium]WKD59326.1 ATP-dependent RNA helicase RhlE [Corynebacterium caspium DSM 44850]